MRKTGRLILLLAAAAFLAGLMPTLLNFWDQAVVYSVKEGLSLHPRFAAELHSFWVTAKAYTWHFTVLYACVIGWIIFTEGQNPDRTILWLLTLIFVPVIGVLLYVVIGPDMHNLRNRRLFKPAKPAADRTPFTPDKRFLIGRLLHSSCGADLTVRNRLEVLVNGEATFGALKRELAAAKTYIDMEYFIIHDDVIGREVRDLLAAAAKRGVRVRVLCDAVGSWGLGAKFFKPLTDAGAECHQFMPVAFPLFRRQMNYRNHRKITVIDGHTAFTGGLNLGDEYLGRGPLGFWRDTHVMVCGEAAAGLHRIFLHDWCVRTGQDFDKVCAYEPERPSKQFAKLPILPMQVVASGVDNVWHSISQGYNAMISRARERVWITTPYLAPGHPIMTSLTSAALAGVDVRILMPSKKDHFLVFWGSRGNVESLLRAGVRVFMYKNGFVHAKTLVGDSDVCSVGTCNMDVRSLEINFENQLFIYDSSLNAIFAAQFETDMKDAEEVLLSVWERRPLWQKLLESFGRLYSAQI